MKVGGKRETTPIRKTGFKDSVDEVDCDEKEGKGREMSVIL
ncbi:hypothetical protein Cabys_616 [Caldithrix abyssi DSM 13497]|uniref:Uncharacterized protein n=1 Tax=Caldithrix abyssi DSM 13497 TaxID=880073 RepID=A0A1J1C3Y3_CALAY|nr:hypothetical protein Cabys_616 [Caldithrix abyssi DSM 13497]